MRLKGLVIKSILSFCPSISNKRKKVLCSFRSCHWERKGLLDCFRQKSGHLCFLISEHRIYPEIARLPQRLASPRGSHTIFLPHTLFMGQGDELRQMRSLWDLPWRSLPAWPAVGRRFAILWLLLPCLLLTQCEGDVRRGTLAGLGRWPCGVSDAGQGGIVPLSCFLQVAQSDAYTRTRCAETPAGPKCPSTFPGALPLLGCLSWASL